MDVLSSMATLAGYRAVLLAAGELPKIFPLLMTAAGTLLPARVFVIGAGVAGLQAMATARRLGAIVEGYDVRPAAREQVESVGAKFVELGLDTRDAEAAGGYAQVLGDRFYAAQQAAMARSVADADVVICTAAVPGQPSPMLIPDGAVRGMRPGSVIVDLAAERGGNCECTRADQKVVAHCVTILGPTNAPGDLPQHASQMFARNVVALLQLLVKDNALNLNDQDEIIRETIVTRGGQVVHPKVLEMLSAAAP
jgi:NAD(P) transhydrogenase subunit alpha